MRCGATLQIGMKSRNVKQCYMRNGYWNQHHVFRKNKRLNIYRQRLGGLIWIMKQSKIMIPEDEDTRKALNVLARHQTIYNLYRDILIDMMVCEIEGWDKKEYLNQLKSVIEHFERKGSDADAT